MREFDKIIFVVPSTHTKFLLQLYLSFANFNRIIFLLLFHYLTVNFMVNYFQSYSCIAYFYVFLHVVRDFVMLGTERAFEPVTFCFESIDATTVLRPTAITNYCF